MAVADATAAMTIDFLRARLLSERSVSRAAKERADQLATRVAELEEQLRTVTAQRRKAERAAAEVLAILDSQGFGRLSDAGDDSGSDDEEADAGGPDTTKRSRGGGGNARGDAPEDAMSGSELGGQAAAAAAEAHAGGLSWKGRAAGPDWDRRRPQQHQLQRGRHMRPQRHGHAHRRGYFYSRAADASPKYHPGLSCRKIKKKELRSQMGGGEGKEDVTAESAEEGRERSDCTVCTDEHPDLDGEVSQDGQGSSSNGRVDGVGDRCGMDCGKDGEMERVLEKQAELIGQYEAEENAQREWEKKFSESRDSTMDDVNLSDKLNQTKNAFEKRKTAQITDKEVVSEPARSNENSLFGIIKPSKHLPKGFVSDLASNEAEDSAIEQCKIDTSDHYFEKSTATVASRVELQVRKDVLVTESYPEIVEGSGNNLGKSALSPQGSCDSSLTACHNKGQGDENSDSGSTYNVNARSSVRYINTPSVGSLSETPKSEVSEWSSSCFHNHTDNQLDTQLYQPSSNDVGSVLEALQRAKMSLREKMSRPSPPSQNMLALAAPEDCYTKHELAVNDMQFSLSRSTPLSHETLALQAPAYHLNRILPQDDVKVPVGHAGLFRVPTDSFPANWMASNDGYGSRFSLTGTSQVNTLPSYAVNHITSTSLFSQHGSGFSPNPYCYPNSSVLLPMASAGGCSVPESDYRIGSGSFLTVISRPRSDLRRRMPSGDAGMLFQYGGD